MPQRNMIDIEAYVHRSRHGPCFICQMAAGDPAYRHHIIYQDDKAIVFLNKYPTVYGYTLVAPRQHREQVTHDFTLDEYVSLQRLIYRVGGALRQVVPTERLYILSLGSQQGNSHVHWHLVPLPPGVPYEKQQLESLNMRQGVLQLSDQEMADLANRIRQAMEALAPSR
jgi:ATP adenylyltransferase